MDESKYDEFGNLIGEIDSSSDDDDEEEEEEEGEEEGDGEDGEIVEMDDENEEIILNSMQLALQGTNKPSEIVQYDEKQYYPTSKEIYGEEVEHLIEREDMQALEEPIIKPRRFKRWEHYEPEIPKSAFEMDFFSNILSNPKLVRNIALIGNIHSGKTSFIDSLVCLSHPEKYKNKMNMMYTDHRYAERKRGISIKSSPFSTLVQSSKGKSYGFHFIDTPGHMNFSDEVSASLRLCDGAVLFIDCVEGMSLYNEQLIGLCLRENIPMCLFFNKIDRLILELRLPPKDSYMKLRFVLKEVNDFIRNHPLGGNVPLFSPLHGNVCFGSSLFHWNFTLSSFAQFYSSICNPLKLSKKLWGEYYFNHKTKKFEDKRKQVRKDNKNNNEDEEETPLKRSFVEFILEPLYKLFSRMIGSDPVDLVEVLLKLKIRIKKNQLLTNVKPLMNTILKSFFGPPTGFVDMILQHVPSPLEGSETKMKQYYTGPLSSSTSNQNNELLNCDPNASLLIQITKFYHRMDRSSFDAFGRVLSGTVKRGQKVKVLGEHYTNEDEEDVIVTTISDVWVYNTRYRVGFDKATAGNLVLLGGVSSSVIKTATIVGIDEEENRRMDQPKHWIFKPLDFATQPVMKVSVEPLNPTELPQMIDGLEKVEKSYPLLISKSEESGERVLVGTGELYMDCVLFDLRRVYSTIEIKVSDPVVVFRETVLETSSIRCHATTPNGENRISMIAQPMEHGLSEEIEKGDFSLSPSTNLKDRMNFFGKFQGWDLLSSKSAWSFGPTDNSPNILMNETFPNEVKPEELNTIRDSIIQGFRWATKEGPLIEEPMRNVKFKLIHTKIAEDVMNRSSGQIIPTTRRVVNSSMLTASPRLMEPIFKIEIQSPLDYVKAIYEVLERRRGHVISDDPKPGTPFYILRAFVPGIDSFGMETDIRAYTHGQAFCISRFDHWDLVPGDPLDDSIVLKPLEPSPTLYLAREFLLKTRRRKGLIDDVNLAVYLDEKDRAYLRNL